MSAAAHRRPPRPLPKKPQSTANRQLEPCWHLEIRRRAPQITHKSLPRSLPPAQCSARSSAPRCSSEGVGDGVHARWKSRFQKVWCYFCSRLYTSELCTQGCAYIVALSRAHSARLTAYGDASLSQNRPNPEVSPYAFTLLSCPYRPIPGKSGRVPLSHVC